MGDDERYGTIRLSKWDGMLDEITRLKKECDRQGHILYEISQANRHHSGCRGDIACDCPAGRIKALIARPGIVLTAPCTDCGRLITAGKGICDACRCRPDPAEAQRSELPPPAETPALTQQGPPSPDPAHSGLAQPDPTSPQVQPPTALPGQDQLPAITPAKPHPWWQTAIFILLMYAVVTLGLWVAFSLLMIAGDWAIAIWRILAG
jgi:hypothetical protein